MLEPTLDDDERIARLLSRGSPKTSKGTGGEETGADEDDELNELNAMLESLASNPKAAEMLSKLIEGGGFPSGGGVTPDKDLPFPEDADPAAMAATLAAFRQSAELKRNMEAEMMQIKPQPGLVIKTNLTQRKEEYPQGMKVFINLCHSPDIPPPPTMDYEEVSRAMLEGDNVSFKVPLSLSPPRVDKDKAGKMCLVFDAACNTAPYQQATKDGPFHAFMVTLCTEWIESKHELTLSRDFTFPKLKSKGEIATHSIRKQPKSIIMELPKESKQPVATAAASSSVSVKATVPLAGLASTGPVRPSHEIFREPPQGRPEFLVVRVPLPQLISMKGAMVLDVEERALFLTPSGAVAESRAYLPLEVALPCAVVVEEVGAQYDLSTRVLTVTLVAKK
ncbi:pre-RNA processing PIH1/Nop17-domain-containing protein [Chytriomyces sp. MP71]|nr:pre-RNA processing PIH1/Nop17-domain-containing protein [Chytriomyces sp. MP71]